MEIKINKKNYVSTRYGNKTYVYQQHQKKNMLYSFLNGLKLFVMRPKLPLALEITNGKNDVTVDENLHVEGTTHYKHFIIQTQYSAWNKMYKSTYFMLAIMSIAITFTKEQFGVASDIVAVILFIFALLFLFNFRKEMKTAASYEIREMNV